MRTRPRGGFTLFQLLIVLAILFILLGLLLPTLAGLRERAVRMQSQNNLKQLALAAHNYHDANGHFPPGCDDRSFSAAAYLLPYIEQENVFRQIDFTKAMDDKANAQTRAVEVKTFLNPTDAVKRVSMDYGATNYLFSAGTKYALKDNDGVFYLNSKIKLVNDIPDGTSNTLLAVEALKGDGGMKATDVRRQHVALKKDDLKNLTEKSGEPDWKDGRKIAADRCASWMDGRFLQGTFTATRAFNDERPDVTCGGAGGLAAPRSLTKVVNVALCDGSVRGVTDKTAFKTWQLIAGRNDGQVVPADF